MGREKLLPPYMSQHFKSATCQMGLHVVAMLMLVSLRIRYRVLLPNGVVYGIPSLAAFGVYARTAWVNQDPTGKRWSRYARAGGIAAIQVGMAFLVAVFVATQLFGE